MLAPSKRHHTVVWKGCTEINGQAKTSRCWQRTVFGLWCPDSKRNSINSLHMNVVKFWHHQSSVIHRFVLKITTEQSPSILLYPWQQSMPQSQQPFRKFNGSRWSLFDHNNRITCWFLPYCLYSFQGKGQRLVCRLPQINCIVGLQGYWFHNYMTKELKILFHHYRREYMKFGPVGIYPDAEAPFETTSVLVQCSRYVQYRLRGDETGCCDGGMRCFCCWWRERRQQTYT